MPASPRGGEPSYGQPGPPPGDAAPSREEAGTDDRTATPRERIASPRGRWARRAPWAGPQGVWRSERAPWWRGIGAWENEGERRAGARLPWRSTLLVLAFTVVGTRFAERGQPERADLDVFAAVLLVLAPALLVLRHRHPVVTVFGTSAAAMLYLGAGYPYGPLLFSVVIACYAAIVAGRRYAAWGALAMLWSGHLLIAHWLYRWLPPSGDGPAPWGQELVVGAWVVAVLAASELARARREQWARDRAERAAAARRRADKERLRIARELHDVLAHSISVINVQAGVGLALLDQDPEQARAALTTIKAASKEALGEVRQVLDALRAPGAAPRAPAPGLDRLGELTEQASGAGLAVDVSVEGTRSALPPGADLAAFRIVQEALTNVIRHSQARTARVRLRYTRGALELRVEDDGPAASAGPRGGGHGLVGMGERAAALGGTVTTGPRPDGGFRVLARLPLARAGAVEPEDTGTVGAAEKEGEP
ncbi:sensor histidine kinase [Streptomyces sp. LX-29]|uniref:sensor histidine kinase n=1 Tax=Streptomyces sp. LX-29 TaxID=2900152 RepID=UPI00240D4B4C|nr:sensor histidine kinase [Streptomyces sp. LX-29]WFB06409.1 sensor histidine kinase [Streptomyces sp. LX-29]